MIFQNRTLETEIMTNRKRGFRSFTLENRRIDINSWKIEATLGQFFLPNCKSNLNIFTIPVTFCI